jgi:hypothetical protein
VLAWKRDAVAETTISLTTGYWRHGNTMITRRISFIVPLCGFAAANCAPADCEIIDSPAQAELTQGFAGSGVSLPSDDCQFFCACGPSDLGLRVIPVQREVTSQDEFDEQVQLAGPATEVQMVDASYAVEFPPGPYLVCETENFSCMSSRVEEAEVTTINLTIGLGGVVLLEVSDGRALQGDVFLL